MDTDSESESNSVVSLNEEELTEGEILERIALMENGEDNIEDEPVPFWIKYTLIIYRIIKIAINLTFLVLLLVYTLNATSIPIRERIHKQIIITSGTFIIIISFITIISCINELLFEYGRCTFNPVVYKTMGAIKYLNGFISMSLLVCFIISISLKIDPSLNTLYELITSYVIIEYGLSFVVFSIALIMMCFGARIMLPDIIVLSLRHFPLRTGASDEQLRSLITYKLNDDKLVPADNCNINIMKDYDITDKEKLCIICRVPMQNDDSIRLLDCKHFYHKECCDEWLKIKKICPMCRRIIFPKKEIESTELTELNSVAIERDVSLDI